MTDEPEEYPIEVELTPGTAGAEQAEKWARQLVLARTDTSGEMGTRPFELELMATIQEMLGDIEAGDPEVLGVLSHRISYLVAVLLRRIDVALNTIARDKGLNVVDLARDFEDKLPKGAL